MLKLTKEQRATLESFRTEIADLASELNAKIDEFNAFRQEVADEQEDYFNGRSETWQEGDKGSAYTDWMDAWSCDLDPADDPSEALEQYTEACDAS